MEEEQRWKDCVFYVHKAPCEKPHPEQDLRLGGNFLQALLSCSLCTVIPFMASGPMKGASVSSVQTGFSNLLKIEVTPTAVFSLGLTSGAATGEQGPVINATDPES